MPSTTNFGWTTPADTDLVKDGAAAIRTLGNGVDASFVDLKGGTTGQVLSKNSNTDLDFAWVAQDDSNAIQNAIVDAKGDLITATAADTPARLAVGTNGQFLTADSTTATGLKWSAPSSGAWVYITGATLTNASTWNFPDNTFTSTYRNYVVVMEGRDASNNDAIYWFFRAGGTNNASGNVKFAVDGLTFDNGTFTQTGTANTYFLAGYPNASGGAYTITIYAPQVATYTQATGVASGTSGATNQGGHTSFSAFVNATTQYDAMGFTMSANSYTGTYRVYGLADA